MLRGFVVSLAAIAVGVPATGLSQDAQSILRRVVELQTERRTEVTDYVIEVETMGNRSRQLYGRMEVTGADGTTYEAFLPVTGGALAPGIEDGLADAGLPPGLLSATGSDSTALNPGVLMGNAEFLSAVAAAQSSDTDGGGPEGAQAANDMAAFARTARLVGTEAVDGRNAFHLRADGLDITQETDGQEFTLQTMSLWIDTEQYVPLRMKMDGVATVEGESRPISIERLDSDYRTVPGSEMYESYRQTMKIGGLMDPTQQAELEEAQEQLAELDRQLASMPPEQRAMMERMMGSQLEMIRNMASGGGFEVETVVHEILVNTGLAGN